MESRESDDDFADVQTGSLMEKLMWVDQEIRTLHQFCLTNGYEPREIKISAEPLWKPGQAAKRRQQLLAMLTVSVIAGLVGVLVYYDPAYRLVNAYTRIAMIQVLPYWDWTRFYKDGCLLENPYFRGDKEELFLEDCEVCESIESIDRVSNLSQTRMTENYIKRDIPVIVTDGVTDWPAQTLFTLQFLYELYNTDDVLKRAPPCMFSSNLRMRPGNARFFLTKAFKGDLSEWYAHWENCDRSAVRFLRQFYRRPYFLPPMVEAADRNWIFLSSNYRTKNFKQVDMAMPLMWMAQLRGENKVKLVPRHPCNSTCTTLYAVLHEGDTVAWTDFIWTLDYIPTTSRDGLSVAIGSGGYYD